MKLTKRPQKPRADPGSPPAKRTILMTAALIAFNASLGHYRTLLGGTTLGHYPGGLASDAIYL